MSLQENHMRFVVLAAVLISALLWPAVGSAQQEPGTTYPAPDPCVLTKAISGYSFCVTSWGTLGSIKGPTGVEHLKVADPLEGFSVCRNEDGIASLTKWGVNAEDGIVESLVSQPNGPNTTPLMITHVGYFGLKFRQTYSWDSSNRSLRIEMRVYNTSTVPMLRMSVLRGIDFDMAGDVGPVVIRDGNPTYSGDDHGGASLDSVWAWENKTGLMLTASTPSTRHFVALTNYSNLEMAQNDQCHIFDEYGPSVGGPTRDLAGAVLYDLGTIYPGKYKTVSVTYRLF
jgi:hypothetical protein